MVGCRWLVAGEPQGLLCRLSMMSFQPTLNAVVSRRPQLGPLIFSSVRLYNLALSAPMEFEIVPVL